MSYRIYPRTKMRAEAIGVEVRPSTNKGKKIDVYKDGKKVASIGAKGLADFPTYLAWEKQGKVEKGTAEARKRAYKARHVYRNIKGTPAYYADQLLWT